MTTIRHALYGDAPRELVEVPADAVQCSPRRPGSTPLEVLDAHSCGGVTLQAPASTIERRSVLAHALRVLEVGGSLCAFAANDKGGQRIAEELSAFGCPVATRHKSRHQIISTVRPAELIGLEEAIAAGAARLIGDLGLWSQPGLFNWDRIDPGSQLLLNHLPVLSGRGADLGCGIGVLSRAVLASSPLAHIVLIDIDHRAIAMAQRNLPADRTASLWADVRDARHLPIGLDFVICNPPFHDGGEEDRALGQAFIQRAAGMLKPGGTLWLTANRHLPYETTLTSLFAAVDLKAQANGFKIYAAQTAAATARTSTSAKSQPGGARRPRTQR
jgi:16S rRNA (guanine1207-N2)-methyltransferase